MSTAAHRYAVYFAPPAEHPLWNAGCQWLGRDPRRGQPLRPPRCEEVRAPWCYGWHATLRPPMALADGVDEARWFDAVGAIARVHRRFRLPALQVSSLNDFLALRPAKPVDFDHALRRLADDCVRGLDDLRAPLTPAARARYLRPHLSARQRAHVERHGYPYVLDDWRFHLTLTGSLSSCHSRVTDALRREARGHFQAALALPLECDALCVFVEPEPGAPFELVERVRLMS